MVGLCQQSLPIFVAIVLVAMSGQASAQALTPTDAVARAIEPMRELSKLKEPTLEDSLRAEKEKQRLAIDLAKGFKVADWKDEDLFSLARLYEIAGQPAEAENAFRGYLLQPLPTKATQARISLVNVLVAQKKLVEAIPTAEILIAEPAYNPNQVTTVQFLIDGLRRSELKQAIRLAEQRETKLFQYVESVVGKSELAGHAAKVLGDLIQLGAMYRENGDVTKADAYLASCQVKFNGSSLSQNPLVKRSFEADLLRLKLVGHAAAEIEGTEYLGLPSQKLGDLKGKVILLDFFAHWCGPCLATIPETNALKEKYEEVGLAVIGLTNYYGFYGAQENLSPTQELSYLKELLTKRKVRFGIMIGPKTNEAAYGVLALPAAAVIDRQGKIRYLKQGAGYKQDVEKIILQLLAEPVPALSK